MFFSVFWWLAKSLGLGQRSSMCCSCSKCLVKKELTRHCISCWKYVHVYYRGTWTKLNGSRQTFLQWSIFNQSSDFWSQPIHVCNLDQGPCPTFHIGCCCIAVFAPCTGQWAQYVQEINKCRVISGKVYLYRIVLVLLPIQRKVWIINSVWPFTILFQCFALLFLGIFQTPTTGHRVNTRRGLG